MPESRILVCGTSIDAKRPAVSLEMLRKVTLPNASKFLVVTGKFEAQEVKKFNVEADYPAEPEQLQTMAAWAELTSGSDARVRDGYDLFCLRSILKKHGQFSHAVLLRHAGGLEEPWEDLAQRLGDRLFVVFGEVEPERAGGGPRCNVLFRLGDDEWTSFIDQAWGLYASGAVYALGDYSFELALGAVAESLAFQQQTAAEEQVKRSARRE